MAACCLHRFRVMIFCIWFLAGTHVPRAAHHVRLRPVWHSAHHRESRERRQGLCVVRTVNVPANYTWARICRLTPSHNQTPCKYIISQRGERLSCTSLTVRNTWSDCCWVNEHLVSPVLFGQTECIIVFFSLLKRIYNDSKAAYILFFEGTVWTCSLISSPSSGNWWSSLPWMIR